MVGIALPAMLAAGALAETTSELTAQQRRGEALLARLCAGCHAIGRTGVGPHPEAPLFRALSRRYKIEALEEALAEGLISGHPDMPEFQFTAQEVGDVVAYLNAIQEPAPDSPSQRR
jgi:mono/diheme cytochrome c family protein